MAARSTCGLASDSTTPSSARTSLARRLASWSLFNGLGVRAGGQIVGLIGSTAGVVELQLRTPVPLRFAGWPWTVDRIAISIEDPPGFIEAVLAPKKDRDTVTAIGP
jgi:hypothetical protein